MDRPDAFEVHAQSASTLGARHGVTAIALSGSTARDAASSNGAIGELVGFEKPATWERYFGVRFCLDNLFGCTVDLVTKKALRSELQPFMERQAVRVWRGTRIQTEPEFSRGCPCRRSRGSH